MNNEKNTLRLHKRKRPAEQPFRERLSLLFAAVPIFCGLCGMVQQLCPMNGLWFLLGLCAAVLAVCLSWERLWQRAALLAVCAAGVLLCFLCSSALAQGVAAVGNCIGAMLTQRTGYYYPPYANAALNGLTSAMISLLLGGLTAAAVRSLHGIPHFCCAFGILLLVLFQMLEGSIWLAVYLTGTLLLLVRCASGSGKSMAAALLIVAVVAVPIGALAGTPRQTDAGRWLTALFHQVRYESAQNPMPEGNLQDLGAFSPSQEAALELRMEEWSAVYLRGYVGSVYLDQGWSPTDKTAIAEEAEHLYAIQKSGFSPTSQRGAAEAALDQTSENTFSVLPLGACSAYSYVPYGAELSGADPRALLTEGSTANTATEGILFDVADSYLVQAQLAEGAASQSYTDAEAAYRDWVYAQYLTVPESAYACLADCFPLPTQTLTTSEARALVLSWVESTLTYDESTVAKQGDLPFLEYLLTVNPRGYSVQYATLATLLMRCCGIPARYVEGYLLSEADAADLENNTTVVLTQENAHAWTEIYLDGVGWIPFDTTPAHQNEITYELPPDGSTAGGVDSSQNSPQQNERQELQIQQQEQEPTEPSSMLLLWCLLGLLLLTLLLLLVRALWLRRRLKKRIDRFSSGEAQSASLDCLRYTQTVLESLGLAARNVPLTRRAEEIAALLDLQDTAPVMDALAFAAELRFSAHPVEENQRTHALELMQTVCSVWNRKTKLSRRIFARWVRCSIL